MRTRQGTRRLAVAASIAGLTLAGCSTATSSPTESGTGAPPPPVAAASSEDRVNPEAKVSGPITIGYEDVGSSKVMAEAYGKALKEAGFDVQLTVAGEQADFISAMEAGVVDLLPAYSGLFANSIFRMQNNDADPPVWTNQGDAASAVNDMGSSLGLEMLSPSPVNEGAAFAVTKDFSEANGVTTLSQMAEWSQKNPMRLGADPTCKARPSCLPSLVKTYGMVVKDFVEFSTDGAEVKAALLDDGAEMGWLSGSDPAADSPDLLVLTEDKPLNIYRNIAPVIRRDIATPELVAALDAVTQKVTSEDLDTMVQAVQVDGEPVGQVAGALISAKGLGEGLYTGPTKVVSVEVPQTAVAATPFAAPAGGPLRISYAPLTDTEIAARVYAAALKSAGIDVLVGDSLESADLLAAMQSGEVQFAPMRLNAVANVLNSNENGPLALPIEGRDINKMVSQARAIAEPLGIEIQKPSLANVSNAWVVNKNFVANTGITKLSELARVSEQRPVVMGGPPPCPDRTWCKPFLVDKYGTKFSQFVPLDWSGGLTRGAIDTGAIDVGWMDGNDGGIEQFGFTVLQDDLGRDSVNPITPVLGAAVVTPEITKVLDKVSNVFTTDDLKAMNHQVEFERKDMSVVVAKFIKDKGLG